MPDYARRQVGASSRDTAINALGLVTRRLAEVKRTTAANAAAGTEFVTEAPRREAGDTRPESERLQTTAIIGKLSHDHEGNETGLGNVFGVAVAEPKTGTWTQLAPAVAGGFIAASLTHSWTNVAGYTASYMKDSMGFVRLHGRVSGGELSQPILTLPAGLRPATTLAFACVAKAGAPGSQTFAGVLVNSEGAVILSTGSNSELDLAGVASFLGEH